MELALQLWSVKDETANDFFGTLKTLSEMGYTGVEFAGYGGKDAKEMRAKLDEYGLKAVGSHIFIERFTNNLQEEIDYNLEIGNKYLICPWAKFESKLDLENIINVLNNAAAEAKKYGLKVGYHNHDQEFEKFDGEYILDLLIKNTTDVVFEIDVFWISYAGINPIEYIKKWGDRIELVHLKQIDGNKKNVDLADGIIDMNKVVENSTFAKHFIVEQEHFEESTPMQSAKSNAEFMLK